MENEWKPDFKKVADRYVRRTLEGKTESELEVAAENFAKYLSIIWDMQDRLEREGLNLSKEETEGEDRRYLCKSCCPPLEDGPIPLGLSEVSDVSPTPAQGSLPFNL